MPLYPPPRPAPTQASHPALPPPSLPVVCEEEEQVLVSLALNVELDRGGEISQDARHGLAASRVLHTGVIHRGV